MGYYEVVKPTCNFCGQPIPTQKLILTQFDEKWVQLCPNCYNFLNSCATCENSNDCGISNDTSGAPKMVMKQVQQGGMYMSTQVINPALQDKYCPTCRCFSDNCQRQDNNGRNCLRWTISSALLSQI